MHEDVKLNISFIPLKRIMCVHVVYVYSTCVCWVLGVHRWRMEEKIIHHHLPHPYHPETTSVTESETHHILGRLMGSKAQGSYPLPFPSSTVCIADITVYLGSQRPEANSLRLFIKHCYAQSITPPSWSSFLPMSFLLRLLLTKKRVQPVLSKTWHMTYSWYSFLLRSCWCRPSWRFGRWDVSMPRWNFGRLKPEMRKDGNVFRVSSVFEMLFLLINIEETLLNNCFLIYSRSPGQFPVTLNDDLSSVFLLQVLLQWLSLCEVKLFMK